MEAMVNTVGLRKAAILEMLEKPPSLNSSQ